MPDERGSYKGRFTHLKYAPKGNEILYDGAPEEIRTPDPQIRSLVLYPAELRVHTFSSLHH